MGGTEGGIEGINEDDSGVVTCRCLNKYSVQLDTMSSRTVAIKILSFRRPNRLLSIFSSVHMCTQLR